MEFGGYGTAQRLVALILLVYFGAPSTSQLTSDDDPGKCCQQAMKYTPAPSGHQLNYVCWNIYGIKYADIYAFYKPTW